MNNFVVKGSRVKTGVAIKPQLEAYIGMLILQSLLQSEGFVRFHSIYMREA